MNVRKTSILCLSVLALLLGATAGAQADHSEFEELQQDFQSGEDVTRACLGCHEDESKEVHATLHWTWLEPGDETGTYGKAGRTFNNFCINVNSNWPRCTSCHVGYGWKDASFDFSAEDKVDCLICHEQTGTYKKFPKGAGYPATKPSTFGGKTYNPPVWAEVAQSVGAPTRDNCGVCHYYGGGGDAVKHGDLDSMMNAPDRALDVHMSPDGGDFSCQECHTTVDHAIAGRAYRVAASAMDDAFEKAGVESQISCESCHEDAPHEKRLLNKHMAKVSCQACHIPTFARGQSTKMWWDWSQAGHMNAEGKPLVITGSDGKGIYNGKKGSFRWESDVTPEFYWYDGSMAELTIEETIDPCEEVWVQKPNGRQDDPDSKLWPFKIHRGKTPYDTVLNNMVVPKLFGKPDSGAYWRNYDWNLAITRGMESVGQKYSGEYGFVRTAYAYPVTHQVAPKDYTTDCSACHMGKRGGKLKPGLGEF